MMAAPGRVVVTQRFFDEATVRHLEDAGCEVVQAELPPGKADGDLTHDELVAALDGASGWIVGHARVTAELLRALPRLRVIARRGVGYDRVDVPAAKALGKVVCIAAGGNDASVAEHALALMLALGHRFREAHRNMLGDDWTILAGTDLYRKTVGIIGLGRTGRSLAQRLRTFEADLLVVSGQRDDAFAAVHGLRYVELTTLLGCSDYVSLHTPLTEQTRLMIDAAALARMKPGAILVNTARGGLVDDRALLAALKGGRLAGAGLDTFQSEADPSCAPVTQELIGLPNVIATPHAAASTKEALQRTNMIAAQCVTAILNGSQPPTGCLV